MAKFFSKLISKIFYIKGFLFRKLRENDIMDIIMIDLNQIY